ncbi:DUF397 domain-containing protein [Streptomyces sp. UNOC14_S4]|uniref:DUF397 domain-containing protein n=1 Tax=Streptomyces sp. UNOC14_S4 TaxID=2872340 RepID=UPI001E39A5A0|nr:DUF397 domain-containing protein [Streptomyces sp. UNOC14_S4]MCC3767581.1 DUF397 domain-containing protein [Streptomyces sp. UNOC14_S4]
MTINGRTRTFTASDLAPPGAWFKASSSGNANTCVMVANLTATEHDGIGLHDSKNPEGPALLVHISAFTGFVASVRTGSFHSTE